MCEPRQGKAAGADLRTLRASGIKCRSPPRVTVVGCSGSNWQKTSDKKRKEEIMKVFKQMQDSSSATTQRPGENRRNNVGNLDVEIDTCAKCARTLKQTELEERLHFLLDRMGS
jgi:hypothetical protein